MRRKPARQRTSPAPRLGGLLDEPIIRRLQPAPPIGFESLPEWTERQRIEKEIVRRFRELSKLFGLRGGAGWRERVVRLAKALDRPWLTARYETRKGRPPQLDADVYMALLADFQTVMMERKRPASQVLKVLATSSRFRRRWRARNPSTMRGWLKDAMTTEANHHAMELATCNNDQELSECMESLIRRFGIDAFTASTDPVNAKTLPRVAPRRQK
jgi:hypothetical protein